MNRIYNANFDSIFWWHIKFFYNTDHNNKLFYVSRLLQQQSNMYIINILNINIKYTTP